MNIVNHIIENLGEFEVDYVGDITYEDIKEILEGLQGDTIPVNCNFERIGWGSSGNVYSYKDYAIKVLHKNREFGNREDNDVQVLKDLKNLDCIPTLHAVINNRVMIVDRVKGLTVGDVCDEGIEKEGILIDEEFKNKWHDSLIDVISNGYSPKDLHQKNVMIQEGTSKPIFIDVGWFSKLEEAYDTKDTDSLKSDRGYNTANYWTGSAINQYLKRKNQQKTMPCN